MFNKRAFTLIELLVTISIIGILSAFVFIQMNGAVNTGKDVQRKSDIELLANALVSYSSDHYNSKPTTDGNGCTLNGGTDPCSIEIEDSLKSYLPTLPDDPNSNASYIYQSNGNDCTISASLSDGTTYQYSCTNDATTTGTPTDGVCGGAKKAYLPEETAFSGTFCDGGTLISEPTFPSVQGTEVSWQCAGEYLGSSTTCTAQLGKNGACGSRNNASTADAYAQSDTDWPASSEYCSAGTASDSPSFPAAGSSTSWNCNRVYAGTDASCNAYHSLNGVCGSSNGGTFESAPTSNLCSETADTPTVTGSTTFTWSCTGLYAGTTNSCTAYLDNLYGSHNSTDCTNAGGTLFSIGSYYICKFNGGSCPGGWSQYANYSESTARTCTATSNYGSCTCTATSGSHDFSNTGISTETGACWTGYGRKGDNFCRDIWAYSCYAISCINGGYYCLEARPDTWFLSACVTDDSTYGCGSLCGPSISTCSITPVISKIGCY